MQWTDLNLQIFFAIQVMADVVLCVAVLFLLARVNRELRRKPPGTDPGSVAELKRMIEDSQRAAAGFLEAMEESKKALRDISSSIDEKESRLRDLMGSASTRINLLDRADTVAEQPRRGGDRDEVIRLAEQGLTPTEIAGSLSFSEAEVRLIIDLARRRSDSR